MELEIGAQPTPLFDVALATSVADGRLRSTLESYDAEGNSTGIIAAIEEGTRLPTTPLLQATATATLRWLMQDGRWVGYVTARTSTSEHATRRSGDQAEGFGTIDFLALRHTIGGPWHDRALSDEC